MLYTLSGALFLRPVCMCLSICPSICVRLQIIQTPGLWESEEGRRNGQLRVGDDADAHQGACGGYCALT